MFSISSGPVAMKGTDYEDALVAQVDNIAEHWICCRVARIVAIPAMSRVFVLVRSPATGLLVRETHPHLMQRRVPAGVRGLCDVTIKHTSTLLVGSWSKTSIKLPKNKIIVQCTTHQVVSWPMPVHEDSINMTLVYKKAKTNQQKQFRHYAVA